MPTSPTTPRGAEHPPSLARRLIGLLVCAPPALGALLLGGAYAAGLWWTDTLVLTQYLFWGGIVTGSGAGVLGAAALVLQRALRLRGVTGAIAGVCGAMGVIAGAWAWGREFNAGPALVNVLRAAPRGGPGVTILQWNASAGAGEDASNPLGDLRNIPCPDVLCVSAWMSGEARRRILAHLGEGGQMVVAGELTLYSRFPIVAHRIITIGPEELTGGGLMRPPAWVQGLLRRLYGQAAVEWRTLENREGVDLVVVTIDTTSRLGRPTVVYYIDMPSSPLLGRWAMSQAVGDRLARLRRGSEGAPALPAPDVLIGDMNTPRGSGSLERLAPGLVHAWDDAGLGRAASWPRTGPILAIDQTLLAPWLRARGHAVLDPGRSEHRAQTLELLRADQ